ncbi:MAG: copper amine oxidase N-terminal domain-containing protein [Clostridia bacterium]|nr:copper amine oxidase N-terminal domain-containing protein [Clostridia bacterium]
MKKFLLTLMAILSISTVTFAGNVSVQLNGEIINFTDSNDQRVDAQIINDRTMVPLRKIFELLGATVDWDDATSTAFATKDDISIKLQIDNPIAEVTEKGVTRKVALDSKPVLINWRTLVPLRFISESLGKQVAWDNANQTAIIIDYDYFENEINKKSPLLYKLMEKDDSSIYRLNISRNYYDLSNGANNNTSNVYSTIFRNSENEKEILVDFNGTSELFKEIVSEGWGTIDLKVNYKEDEVSYSTTSSVLNKMLKSKSDTYKNLELAGKYNEDIGDTIRALIGIDENSINVSTFANMKREFDTLLNSFSYSNSTSASTIKLKNTQALVAGKYIDITNFDNVVFKDDVLMAYNIINKLIFNYDVKNDELIYDYPTINVTMNLSEISGSIDLSMKVELLNDYNEKVVYDVKIAK